MSHQGDKYDKLNATTLVRPAKVLIKIGCPISHSISTEEEMFKNKVDIFQLKLRLFKTVWFYDSKEFQN